MSDTCDTVKGFGFHQNSDHNILSLNVKVTIKTSKVMSLPKTDETFKPPSISVASLSSKENQ